MASRSLFIAVGFGLIAAGCAVTRGVPTVELPPEAPAPEVRISSSKLLIGATLSETGPGAARAASIKQGIVLAADELNESGGVSGRPLEVVFVDDGSDPSVLVNRVAELIF